MAPEEDEETDVIIVGDEDLNEEAVAYIDSILRDDETPVAVAGFDFETKVLVITDQRVLIIGEKGVDLILSHDDIYQMSRDDRTLIIETRSGIQHRCHFAKDQTVEELVELAGAVGSLEEMEVAPAEEEDAQTTQTHLENGNVHPIAERVRFWEEQDKINQELIPRVIRQNELLTKHIAEHDSLPEVAGKAISEALAEARKEQRQQYEAALDAAKGEIAENARAVSEVLAEAREEQRQQYETALDAAKGEIAENARAISEALAGAREEQRGQYESALDAAKGEIAEQCPGHQRGSCRSAGRAGAAVRSCLGRRQERDLRKMPGPAWIRLWQPCGRKPAGRATCSSS